MTHLLVTNDFPPKVGGIQAYLWELWRRLDPTSFAVLTASSHPDAAAFDAGAGGRGIRIERVSGRPGPDPGLVRRIRAAAAGWGPTWWSSTPPSPSGWSGPGWACPTPSCCTAPRWRSRAPARQPIALARVVRTRRWSSRPGATRRPRPAGPSGAGTCRRWSRSRPGSTSTLQPDGPGSGPGPGDLGLPPRGPLVVSVSRLVPRKGMDVLIDAAAACRPDPT